MKIAAAALEFRSQHIARIREETRETLRAWVRPPATEARLSDAGKAAQAAEAAEIAEAGATDGDPVLAVLKAVIEMLTGRAVRVFDADELRDPAQAAEPAAPPQAGFGIEYDFHAVREEIELTSFAAEGSVTTADGRTIAVRLDLAMTRQFREELTASLRAGDAQRHDPLVINFDGGGARLTDQRVGFDLDADGKIDNVPLLAGGSGYLALDLNGNGRIDSGAELFGPQSGAGFAELARHDDDGNGWIDEGDAVYRRLLVWAPAAEGPGHLSSLKERGIGALYSGHVDTPFELRGQANGDLGAVRASSLYLTDSGSAGVMQEVDLSV